MDTDHGADHETDHPSETEAHVEQPGDPRVRPRMTWGGTLVVLLGFALAGAGVAFHHELLGWGGVVVALLGGAVAVRGGVMNETSAGTPAQHEARLLREGGDSPGTGVGARVRGGGVEARAREATQRQREFVEAPVPRPPLRPFAAFGLLTVGLWLVAGLWLLPYPMTAAGQDDALRAVGAGALFSLCGLRLRLATRSLLASGLALVGGLLFAASGYWMAEALAPQVNEIATGLLASLLALVTVRRH